MWTIFCLILIYSIQICARPSDYYMHPQLSIERVHGFDPAENLGEYWNTRAQKQLYQKIRTPFNKNIAKNIIMFLGDGMSLATIAAARIFSGNEQNQLVFEKFPYTALSKTYSIDKQVSDSAATATAYLGGVKANYGTIGVTAEVTRGDCDAMNNESNHVKNVVYHAQLGRKRTGLVTTTRVTHASPAGAYAHTADRNWECDTDVLAADFDPTICKDIAMQLVYGKIGRNLDVILGGGRRELLPLEKLDEEGYAGSRSDKLNLIDAWLNLHNDDNAQYIYSRTQLINLGESTQKVLGLFASDHMDYYVERDPAMDPTLMEMTEAAIEILDRGPSGYFLFVEGGKIDMAHHENKPKKALKETIELEKAIQRAVQITDESETLIIVTADHSHTMSFSGYADRGEKILGYGGQGEDNKLYTILSYANGPGKEYEEDDDSEDISGKQIKTGDWKYPALVPLKYATHGGEDVPLYAQGPCAHFFSGVIEDSVIPHYMMYAACIGEGIKACG